jgi:MFS family permease
MLRVIKANISGLKYPLYSSLTLSFASFGDAFLYPFLPQHAEVMEIPVVWIGVLLSINRFIRILFNPVVVKLFARYGVRTVTITASVMAIVSTVGYGLGWGLVSLILFRLIWGMAYAIMRISTMAYAFGHEYVGVSLGVGKSIQEAGPMLALWLGPLLLNYFSATNTFFLLALISIPSLLYAISLPDLKYIPLAAKRIAFNTLSLMNLMTYAVSFVVDGMLVVVIGLFLAKHDSLLTGLVITSMTAGYLVYRRVCFIVFSPAVGAVAERIGFIKLFNLSFLMIITGLFLLLIGWVPAGLIIIFTFNSVYSTIAPGAVANEKGDKIKAVASNASWWDIGAATGALTGGALLSADFLFETFTIAIFILVFLFIIKSWKIQRT